MKKLMITPLLALNLLASSGANTDNKEALIAEYKEMFSKISKKRVGVDDAIVDRLKAPFLEVEKKEVKKIAIKDSKSNYTQPFSLQAIFGSRAKISGAWYKVGDRVNGMKLITVRDRYVWLKNAKFRKKLTIGNKNEKISIK